MNNGYRPPATAAPPTARSPPGHGTTRRTCVGSCGRITSLTDLPERAVAAVGELNDALGGDDPARLIGPLADARLHLEDHRDLADRVDHLVQQVDNLRRHTASRRRGVTLPPERQNPGTARR